MATAHSYSIPNTFSSILEFDDDPEAEPLLDNMVTQKVNISQQTLVSRADEMTSTRGTQYLAAIIVTIGGFITGTTLAWSSPAEIPLKNGEYGFPISSEDMAWIGAFMPVGAIAGCVITALTVDLIGRKNLLLVLALPCVVGWAAMVWSNSVLMFCLGRFLTGIAGGSYCTIVPMYTAEIGESDIRGMLGTFLQLQITIGILATYIIGTYVNVHKLTLFCGIIPVVYALLVMWMPETPFFYLKKRNTFAATQSLTWLRGGQRDISSEIYTIQEVIDKDEADKVNILAAFQTTPAKKGLVIGLGVMFLQQFSGCNAVIFYTTTIFEAAGSKINPNHSTIIVGGVSVLATYLATLLVDRLGRRVLLLFSIISMSISTLLLGGYFYAMDDLKMDVSVVNWLPLASLCSYIVVFSLGFGPIPWMLMGEIFPSKIKSAASSVANLFNWSCVFLVTKFFPVLKNDYGTGRTFWFFTLCSIVGTFFVYISVPETKGKSLNEIQEILGGEEVDVSRSSNRTEKMSA